MTTFEKFLSAFPPDAGQSAPLNGPSLAKAIQDRFEVAVPTVLVEFWSVVGSGFFADQEICFFGSEGTSTKQSLLEWNGMDFWSDIFPTPKEGGPVFFAETCFGMQLGFRWDGGVPVGYMLDVDGLEAFRVANNCNELFRDVMTDRHVFTDPMLLSAVRLHLGPLHDGMHYAPIVSPLVGGELSPQNYHFETPNVHLRTAIATWKAIKQPSP